MCLNDTGQGSETWKYLILSISVSLRWGLWPQASQEVIWAMATGESPRFGLLLEPSAMAPVRALVVVAYAPLIILLWAWRFIDRPIAGMLLVAASLGWSFLQGVFILTQFFGVT